MPYHFKISRLTQPSEKYGINKKTGKGKLISLLKNPNIYKKFTVGEKQGPINYLNESIRVVELEKLVHVDFTFFSPDIGQCLIQIECEPDNKKNIYCTVILSNGLKNHDIRFNGEKLNLKSYLSTMTLDVDGTLLDTEILPNQFNYFFFPILLWLKTHNIIYGLVTHRTAYDSVKLASLTLLNKEANITAEVIKKTTLLYLTSKLEALNIQGKALIVRHSLTRETAASDLISFEESMINQFSENSELALQNIIDQSMALHHGVNALDQRQSQEEEKMISKFEHIEKYYKQTSQELSDTICFHCDDSKAVTEALITLQIKSWGNNHKFIPIFFNNDFDLDHYFFPLKILGRLFSLEKEINSRIEKKLQSTSDQLTSMIAYIINHDSFYFEKKFNHLLEQFKRIEGELSKEKVNLIISMLIDKVEFRKIYIEENQKKFSPIEKLKVFSIYFETLKRAKEIGELCFPEHYNFYHQISSYFLYYESQISTEVEIIVSAAKSNNYRRQEISKASADIANLAGISHGTETEKNLQAIINNAITDLTDLLNQQRNQHVVDFESTQQARFLQRSNTQKKQDHTSSQPMPRKKLSSPLVNSRHAHSAATLRKCKTTPQERKNEHLSDSDPEQMDQKFNTQ